jgi:hypothetical protein
MFLVSFFLLMNVLMSIFKIRKICTPVQARGADVWISKQHRVVNKRSSKELEA